MKPGPVKCPWCGRFMVQTGAAKDVDGGREYWFACSGKRCFAPEVDVFFPAEEKRS